MVLEKLKQFAIKKGFEITYEDFGADMESLKGRKLGYLINKTIVLNAEMKETDETFVLAHELAHGYLHCDEGNTMESPFHKQYEEQANRAANLILDLMSLENTLAFEGAM